MRLIWTRDRLGADQVFVEVGAADAGPGDLEEDLRGGGGGEGDVVDADVVGAVEAGSEHCGRHF